MSNIPNLSARGAIAAKTELRIDMELFSEAYDDIWSPSNPNGKFPLNMAENNFCWSMMSEKITDILQQKDLPKWTSNYTGLGGSEIFLEAVADFMSEFLIKDKIDPSHLAASSGAGAVLELAAWVTCDENEVAVIPAPSYPVYTPDLYNKAKVERYNLISHHHIDEIKDGTTLKIEHLEQAKKTLTEQGRKFKLLILTSPDNPTGMIYSKDLLLKIANWCEGNQIHMVVNELYGLSILNDHSKGKEVTFESFAKIINQKQSDFLHLVYGLSKDFGISGFRVGMFYSLNETLMHAYRNLNAPHMVSNLTQYVISEVISDLKFIQKYISQNQIFLSKSYKLVTETLDELNIPYVNAKGSLFVWMELSAYLPKINEEEASNFWLKLYRETGILLTPEDGFGNSKKGQFRLVHSYLPLEGLNAAMEKFSIFIHNIKSKKAS